MSGAESEESEEAVFLLIHILPQETGGRYERKIVRASCIKKFQYDLYKQNKNTYKETKFSYKEQPDAQKHKYYVLYAANGYQAVYDKSQTKRFSIPTHSQTLTDETLSENYIDAASPVTESNYSPINKKSLIAKAKKSAKDKETLIKKHKTRREEGIMETYMNQRQSNSEVEEDSDSLQCLHGNSSTPLKEVENLPKTKDAVTELARQANHYKKLYISARQQNEKLQNILQAQNREQEDSSEVRINQMNNSNHGRQRKSDENECCSSTINSFMHYDVYCYGPGTNLRYDEFGNVILAHGVPCNPKAYVDSYKTSTAGSFLAILSQGVYELEDLASRCVRKQKNNQNKKKLDALKTVALEKEVYRYMRTKDMRLQDIESVLRDLNKIHHQCITKAIKRCKTLESVNQEDLDENEVIDYMGSLT